MHTCNRVSGGASFGPLLACTLYVHGDAESMACENRSRKSLHLSTSVSEAPENQGTEAVDNLQSYHTFTFGETSRNFAGHKGVFVITLLMLGHCVYHHRY